MHACTHINTHREAHTHINTYNIVFHPRTKFLFPIPRTQQTIARKINSAATRPIKKESTNALPGCGCVTKRWNAMMDLMKPIVVGEPGEVINIIIDQ